MAPKGFPPSKLRQFAFSLPGAREDFPWGESVAKVGNKVFVFLGRPSAASGTSLSVKLPQSSFEALELPFAEPTGYGLGKAGWITASFEPGDALPGVLLTAWIEESYRAIAPRKLVARLDEKRGARRSRSPRARPRAKRKKKEKDA